MLCDYRAGDDLPPLHLPALTRHTLALYCGASWDHNRMHTDLDFARQADFPDVIGHGMLTMAFVGRLLTDFAATGVVLEFGVRFMEMAQIGDTIECRGSVVSVERHADGEHLRIELSARVGERVLAAGEALVLR